MMTQSPLSDRALVATALKSVVLAVKVTLSNFWPRAVRVATTSFIWFCPGGSSGKMRTYLAMGAPL